MRSRHIRCQNHFRMFLSHLPLYRVHKGRGLKEGQWLWHLKENLFGNLTINSPEDFMLKVNCCQKNHGSMKFPIRCPMSTSSTMFLHEHELAGNQDLFSNVFFEWFTNPFAEMIQNRKFRDRKNWHCLSCKLVPGTSSDVLTVLPPYFVSNKQADAAKTH